MKVAITGATGVIGRAAVRTLVGADHDVFGLARSAANQRLLDSLGATPVEADLFDIDSLVTLFTGCDVVLSLATRVPVGYAGVLPRAWRESDRLRTDGVANVVEAARQAGVRRLVQESVSFLYVDGGDEWITEDHPLGITRATEPASVAEAQVQEYACDSRQGVVLRLGTVVGDDRITHWLVRGAGRRMPVVTGAPDSWAHMVHTDDLGSAVLAALSAPSGTYNVGAEPVRRRDLAAGFAAAAGHRRASVAGPVLSKVVGPRLEPLTRSLRVSSEGFTAATGWTPVRRSFDPTWLDPVIRAMSAT